MDKQFSIKTKSIYENDNSNTDTLTIKLEAHSNHPLDFQLINQIEEDFNRLLKTQYYGYKKTITKKKT